MFVVFHGVIYHLSKSLPSYFKSYHHVPSTVISCMYHSHVENFYRISGYSIILIVLVLVPCVSPV